MLILSFLKIHKLPSSSSSSSSSDDDDDPLTAGRPSISSACLFQQLVSEVVSIDRARAVGGVIRSFRGSLDSMEMRARPRAFRFAAVAAVAAAVLVRVAAAATTYTVGAPDGLWDLETNYAEWVATRTFHPGDKITFTYSPELHDVVEVSKAGYDACSNANNISAFLSGNDVVALTAVGTRYFLCGFTGHCGSGMKIRIDVVSPGSGPAAAPPATSASSVTAAAGNIGLGVLVLVLLQALMWPCGRS